MWEIKIKHEGLHAYRNVRGASKEEAETKARLQIEAWNLRWKRLLDAEATRQERLKKRGWADKQSDIDKRAKEHAVALTKEAEATLDGLRGLLSRTLGQAHSFNWDSLKDTSRFEKVEPTPSVLEDYPAEPLITEPQFTPLPVPVTVNFFDWFLPGVRAGKLARMEVEETRRKRDAQERFVLAHSIWEKKVNEIKQSNQNASAKHEKAKAAWVLERRIFGETQKLFNSGIDEFKKSYFDRVPAALIRYWTEVLSKSEYPDSFPRDQVVSFDPANGMLVIDFELPPQKAIPNKKQVKYISNRQ